MLISNNKSINLTVVVLPTCHQHQGTHKPAIDAKLEPTVLKRDPRTRLRAPSLIRQF
jgi:hypothetical protein